MSQVTTQPVLTAITYFYALDFTAFVQNPAMEMFNSSEDTGLDLYALVSEQCSPRLSAGRLGLMAGAWMESSS